MAQEVVWEEGKLQIKNFGSPILDVPSFYIKPPAASSALMPANCSLISTAIVFVLYNSQYL